MSFLLSGVANGADFYVAVDGNDRSPGTDAHPFRSIQRGVNAAQSPGDNIIVRKGLYRLDQPVILPNAGSPGRPITLRAAVNETVVIDGSNVVPRDEQHRKSLTLIGIANGYVRVEGFTIRDSPQSGIGIWGPGTRAHHVELRNNTIQNCYASGIQVGFTDPKQGPIDILIEGNDVRDVCLNNAPRKANTVTEKARRLGGRNIPWGSAIGGTARRVTIRGNRVHRSYGEGIGFYLSDETVIESNEVHDNFSVNVYLDNSTNAQVNRNLVYSSGDEDFFRFSHPADGILIANESYGPLSNPCRNNTITSNVLIGNRSAISYGSFQSGGGLKDTLIAHNTAYGSTAALLKIDPDGGHRGTRVVNNIFHQQRAVPITSLRTRQPGLTFAANLWFGGTPEPFARSASDVSLAPQFTKPGSFRADDYQLADSSPARGAGVKMDRGTRTFDNRIRSGIADLGAW
ncbi:MAG: right-handed parallel beta-helix repeat-containing protein [Planctomycetota bacterium]